MEFSSQDQVGVVCFYPLICITNTIYRVEVSAYEKLEWIDKLVAYVADVAEREPQIKIFGSSVELTGFIPSRLTYAFSPIRLLFWTPDRRACVWRRVRLWREMGDRRYNN
jgi:hypothetical protein